MKKYIMINNATGVLERLASGKRVEGVLYVDESTSSLTFKAYNRKPWSPRNRLLRLLEHGWVKESAERIKFYNSIPKALGTARVMSILDREAEEAKMTLVEREVM